MRRSGRGRTFIFIGHPLIWIFVIPYVLIFWAVVIGYAYVGLVICRLIKRAFATQHPPAPMAS